MKNKKRIIISIIIIVFLCVCYTIKNYDYNTDTFYLIKLGEYILNHGINFKDHFSFIQGLTYTYPHWLYSVFIYIIYSKFGFLGIHINNIISFIVLILSIYIVNLKVNKNILFAFFISIISIFLLNSFILARGQVFSLILLFLEVYFINRLIETGTKRYIIFLMIASLLIANLHGTIWMMFFVLYMPFFGEQLVYLIISKKNKGEKEIGDIQINRINNIKLVLISFFLTFLMGLLTPSRICYTYVFRIMLGSSQNFITEHQPLKLIKEPFLIFLITILMFYKGKVKLRELFMIFGVILLSLVSVRHICFTYTIGLLYISKLFVKELNDSKDKTFITLENIIFSKNILFILIISILLIGMVGIKENYRRKYINEDIYPTKAVKYIKNNLDYKNIRMYNNYGIGGYLLFNDIPVFIDPRCDLYLKEFNKGKVEVFNDSVIIYEELDSYKRIFKKYDINYVLLGKNDKLYYVIRNDNEYEKIYNDENFVIFKKKREN